MAKQAAAITTIFDLDGSIDAIMRRWPATIAVVMKNRMLCIGCPVGRFHTVAEACAAHGLDEAEVRGRLSAAISDEAGGTTRRVKKDSKDSGDVL